MRPSGIAKEGVRKIVKILIRSLKPTGAFEYDREMPRKVGRNDEQLYGPLSEFQNHNFRKL
jgi:hypothetical protein